MEGLEEIVESVSPGAWIESTRELTGGVSARVVAVRLRHS